MLASYDPNLPDGQQLVDAFFDNPELVGAWEVLDDAGSSLSTDVASLTKLTNWVDNGLDESKLALALKNANDPDALFNNIDNALSIHHQRVYIEGYTNIPGVNAGTISQGVNISSGIADKAPLPSSWNPDFDLPSGQIGNFSGLISSETLKGGTTIYRVQAYDRADGPWWTLEPPSNVGEVIGGTAVRPEWNNYEYLHTYTVPKGVEIKCWKGKAAKQQITNGVDSPFLEGGTEQIWVSYIKRQDSNFDNVISSDKTGW